VFRATEHEGVAAECLFELFAGDRKLTGETKLRAFAACAVLARTMRAIRGGA
jgi:hypothetical protein